MSKNAYTIKEKGSLLLELQKTEFMLRGSEIFDFVDDISEKSSLSGSLVRYLVSTIEDKIKSMIVILHDSSFQLMVLTDLDGFLEEYEKIYETINRKIFDIEKYYDAVHPSDIVHRYVREEVVKYKKNGDSFIATLVFEAATREKQVKVRSDVMKKLLSIRLYMSKVEEAKDKLTTYGNKEVNESMLHFLNASK